MSRHVPSKLKESTVVRTDVSSFRCGDEEKRFSLYELSFLELICVGFHRYVSIDLGYSLDAKSRVCPVFFLPVILGLVWSVGISRFSKSFVKRESNISNIL